MEAPHSALVGRPFSTREARELGLPPQKLRRKGLTVVTHGARAPEEPTTLAARALAFQAAMSDEVAFSHITAAQLFALPLPRSVERQTELDVMCESSAGPVRREGCFGHRGLERRTVVSREGVRLTGIADTWVDLGEVLKRGLQLDDLVVAGDVVARSLDRVDGEGAGVAALRERLDARVRPRGKRLLAEALSLVSPRAKSPMETRARLVFHRAGLPAPELNAAVHFDGDGVHDQAAGWMLEGDFVWRAQRVIAEYQGDHHKSIQQRSIDVARRHLAEDDGWTFVELFAGDVFNRAKRVAMLRRLARELGVPATTLEIT